MSVNTPASWSAHTLRTRLGMPSGPAALRGLTRLNVLLKLAVVKESPKVLVAGCVSGTVLSSKRAKKLFSLSGSKMSVSVIDCRPSHICLLSEPLNCDNFVSILTLSLFDCLAEGIATLFVFDHVSGRLAMIKSSGLRFQFCANAAINSQYLVGEGFNSHRGYNITDALSNKLTHRISVYINIILRGYREHIKTILKSRIR